MLTEQEMSEQPMVQTEAKSNIPTQYLLEDGNVMPADLVAELNPTQPGSPDYAFQQETLVKIRQKEQERENRKTNLINSEYATLSDEQKAGFADAQLLSNDILGRAIKEEFDFDDLSVEEQVILAKLKEGYQQAKAQNPDQPVNLQMGNKIDQQIYSNLLNRLSLRMVKQNTITVDSGQIASGAETVAASETAEAAETTEDNNKYSSFKVKVGETAPGLTWNEYGNKAAKELKEAGKFQWGKERIYFELPLDSLKAMRDLCMKVAGENNIAIAFKHMDIEKTSPSNYDETRFVTNFASVEDAKRFYTAIAQDAAYAQFAPDRSRDYHGHQLDPIANYANGYREQRGSLEAVVDTASRNPDGTYTYTGTNGKQYTIPESSYQLFSQQLSQMPYAKTVWENA